MSHHPAGFHRTLAPGETFQDVRRVATNVRRRRLGLEDGGDVTRDERRGFPRGGVAGVDRIQGRGHGGERRDGERPAGLGGHRRKRGAEQELHVPILERRGELPAGYKGKRQESRAHPLGGWTLDHERG